MPSQRNTTQIQIILLSMLSLAILAPWLHVYAKDPSKADVSLKDLNGKRVHLRDYQGKIVVLNFWATWCGPCREEMPRLSDAEKEYGPRGVVFIGASLDDSETQGKIAGFVHDHQIDFPIWTGATADDLDRLGMGPAVPATAFLDQEGKIVARVSGEVRQEEIKERLDWLLQGKTGAAPNPSVVHLEGKK